MKPPTIQTTGGFFSAQATGRGAPVFAGAVCLVVLLMCCTPGTLARQQSPAGRVAPRPTAKSDPRFAEVEGLLQEGRFDEAKQKLQEVLMQDPKGAVDRLKDVPVDKIIAVKEGVGIVPRNFPKAPAK